MDSPVQSKCIGIISAIQSEVNLLLSQANIERIDTVGKVDYHVGTLRGQQVVIAKAGVGKVLAASEMTVMLNRYPVTEVIFTGDAGGVGDETQVLDEVVATRLIQHDYSSCTKLYEIAVRSPFSRRLSRTFWRLIPLKIKVSWLMLVYEAVCTWGVRTARNYRRLRGGMAQSVGRTAPNVQLDW